MTDMSIDVDGTIGSLVGRTKNFSIRGQKLKPRTGRYAEERRIPIVSNIQRIWLPKTKNIAKTPSVASILSGPSRTIRASEIGLHTDVASRSIHERGEGSRYPKPYPIEERFKWGKERNIAKIPAVAIVGGRPTRGGQTGLSPSKISLNSDVMPRSTNETPKILKAPSEIWSRSTPWGRKKALRDAQFMPQNLLKNRPILSAMRQRFNMAIQKR